MKTEKEIREEIVAYGGLAYAQGLVSGASGNLSARVDEDHILVTPSGCHKGMLNTADLLLYNIKTCQTVDKTRIKPSSEIRMHTYVYEHRPDIQAVIHAHPPHAVALSVAGISLEEIVLPEVILALGFIVDCGYATPTTEDVVQAMKRPLLEGHNALILARHGSVTLGKTMQEAFSRLETVEHVAKITAIARSFGKVHGLPKEEISKLKKLNLNSPLLAARDEFKL
jgi:L-fuculose-phosphate aldolase